MDGLAEGNMRERCFAHSVAGRPVEEWEPLEDHLQQVANLAGEFADAFGAKHWGELAGLWHDLGKFAAAFQAYLREQNGTEAEQASLEATGQRPRHAIAGARLAEKAGKGGVVLAYCIGGKAVAGVGEGDVVARSHAGVD